MPHNPTFSRSDRWRYSLLALPLAFCGLPLYIHAPDFYATEHQLPLATIAFILLVIRMFDAVQDPIIGRLSDRYASRLGRIMGMAMLGLALGFWLVFAPPETAVAWWFAGSMVLATTAFSVVTINFQALGGIWPKTEADKARIAGGREAVGLVGLLLASALPSLLKSLLPDAQIFQIVSLIFMVLMAVGAWLFFRWFHTHRVALTRPDAPVFRWSYLGHYQNFYLVYGLSALASAIPAILVLFFIRDYLGAEAATGLFLALYFLAGAFGMPLWLAIARRIGMDKAWLFSMLLAVITFIGVYFLQAGDALAYGIICMLSGFALGAELALPPAMLAQKISANAATSHASCYFSILAFLGKATLAVASGITLLLLDHAGFVPAQANAPAAISMLLICYAIIPCVIKLVAAGLLWRLISHEPHESDSHEKPTHNLPIRSSDHA